MPLLLKEYVRADKHRSVRTTALRALARGWQEDVEVLELLQFRVQKDPDEIVRKAASSELKRNWPEDSEVKFLATPQLAKKLLIATPPI